MWIRAERGPWKAGQLAFISSIWGKGGPERGRASSRTLVEPESALLSVWPGSFPPSCSSCTGKDVPRGRSSPLPALACLAPNPCGAGFGRWRNLWQWQSSRERVTSQWGHRSLQVYDASPSPSSVHILDVLWSHRVSFWLLTGSSPLLEDLPIQRKVPQLWGHLNWVWAPLDHRCTTTWPFWLFPHP